MGRASQIFWFLNAEKMPSEEEITNYYTHLYVNDELKKLRSAHRKNLKKLLKEKKENIISEQKRLF
jgi:predicted solute-binding protein